LANALRRQKFRQFNCYLVKLAAPQFDKVRRPIVRDAAKKDNKISAFILGVVNSNAFKMGVTDTGKTDRRATDVAR
jgi:hypothetical protein